MFVSWELSVWPVYPFGSYRQQIAAQKVDKSDASAWIKYRQSPTDNERQKLRCTQIMCASFGMNVTMKVNTIMADKLIEGKFICRCYFYDDMKNSTQETCWLCWTKNKTSANHLPTVFLSLVVENSSFRSQNCSLHRHLLSETEMNIFLLSTNKIYDVQLCIFLSLSLVRSLVCFSFRFENG